MNVSMDMKEALNDPEFRAQYDKLFQDIGIVVRNHINTKEPGMIPVLRALHVLAMHSAVVIAGTNDPASLDFFSETLNSGIQQVRKDFIAAKLTKENEELPE